MRKLFYYFVKQKSPNFSNLQEQVLLYLLERPRLNLPCNVFVAVVIAKIELASHVFRSLVNIINHDRAK